MNNALNYKYPLIVSLALHFGLMLLLILDMNQPNAVLHPETESMAGLSLPMAQESQPKPQIVQATTMNTEEVMQTVRAIKQQRLQKIKVEEQHQQALMKEALDATKRRQEEQAHLLKLKAEAKQLAVERAKQAAEDKAHLKQLALEKAVELKRLEALKSKQKVLEQKQEEAHQLALQQQKAKADAEAKSKQAALDRAKEAGLQQAKLAGEVNKYKALILNAISQRWILPEQVNKSLSSQFRIRLAPDGAVMDVSLIRSSGDPILDHSAQSAIFKASPLPVPTDIATFNLFRDISLTVRPENVRG